MDDVKGGAPQGVLNKIDRLSLRNCDFVGLIMPELGLLQGVSSTLSDLYALAVPKDEDDEISIKLTSVTMLADVARRAVDELRRKLEAASDVFQETGLNAIVRERVDQGKEGVAPLPQDGPQPDLPPERVAAAAKMNRVLRAAEKRTAQPAA